MFCNRFNCTTNISHNSADVKRERVFRNQLSFILSGAAFIFHRPFRDTISLAHAFTSVRAFLHAGVRTIFFSDSNCSFRIANEEEIFLIFLASYRLAGQLRDIMTSHRCFSLTPADSSLTLKKGLLPFSHVCLFARYFSSKWPNDYLQELHFLALVATSFTSSGAVFLHSHDKPFTLHHKSPKADPYCLYSSQQIDHFTAFLLSRTLFLILRQSCDNVTRVEY
jgi:hypothetical protein